MTNPITNTITEMQNATTLSTRNVGGEMGKQDFLMLLTAQLRYQNPMEPMSDSDFAAQLAQFSALEQMTNINETLTTMLSYQAYGLVGKFVVAEATLDGVLSEISGVVDCVFTEKGVLYAQIGEYAVPLTAITEVYDESTSLSPKILLEASNNLLGRTVTGSLDGETVEGEVIRVFVENGVMYAVVIDEEDEEKVIRIETIYDVRKTEEAKPAEKAEDEDDQDGLDGLNGLDDQDGLNDPDGLDGLNDQDGQNGLNGPDNQGGPVGQGDAIDNPGDTGSVTGGPGDNGSVGDDAENQGDAIPTNP